MATPFLDVFFTVEPKQPERKRSSDKGKYARTEKFLKLFVHKKHMSTTFMSRHNSRWLLDLFPQTIPKMSTRLVWVPGYHSFPNELLWATRGAINHNLQVVVAHALHVRSQHSFGLPLRMNGMHRTQFDHSWLDRSCLRSRTCWPMVEDAPRYTREKPSVTQGVNDRWWFAFNYSF